MDIGFYVFFLLALQPNSGLGRLHETFRFTSVTRSRTVGRTTWTGDQLVARPLPGHTKTQKKANTTQTLNIHAQIAIRTHGPGVRASEDSSCLFFFNSHSEGWSRHVDHFWPIVPAPGYCEDGEFGGMKIGKGNRSTWRKPAPAPLCPPQIPLDQTRARTRPA
jgi:hypothetical protein